MISITELLAQTGDAGLSENATPPETQSTATGGATGTSGAAPQGTQRPPAPDNSFGLIFGLMAAMIVFMWVMSNKRQKREQQQRQDMLSKLSKNDRVLTIGGVIGTVVSVKEAEVVLKVDESTNTRMTFARRAIQQVLVGDEPPKLEESR